MYIEKYIEEPKHIEFQILADKFATSFNLGSVTVPFREIIRK